MIKVLVALQGRLSCEAIRSLLESMAGGMEVEALQDRDGPGLAAKGSSAGVILTDMKTVARSFSDGPPEGSRIIVICGEGEDPDELVLSGAVSGVVKESAGPLDLETAIKAVSMGVVWAECAMPGKVPVEDMDAASAVQPQAQGDGAGGPSTMA